jgi:hypothetical protein
MDGDNERNVHMENFLVDYFRHVVNFNAARTSKLRAVIINGVGGELDLLIRCEPVNEEECSWCEKVIVDALKQSTPWTRRFNIIGVFNWYHNDILQINSKGYPVRLFHIRLCGTNNGQELLQMLAHLCATICSYSNNREQLIIDNDELFWINGPVVWSDVIGVRHAFYMLTLYKGNIYPGFFEEHEAFVLTYFRNEHIREFEA